MMKKLKGNTSAVQVSSSSPRCFKTWTQLNWTGAGLTKPNWIGKQKKMSRNKIGFEEAEANLHPGNVEHPDQPWLQLVHPPALLGEPEHLGQIWSSLLSFGEIWWDLVRFCEMWWALENLGTQPGCSRVARRCRRSERRATRSIPCMVIYGQSIPFMVICGQSPGN